MLRGHFNITFSSWLWLKNAEKLSWCHCLQCKQTGRVCRANRRVRFLSACSRLGTQVTWCRSLMNKLGGITSPLVALQSLSFVFAPLRHVWQSFSEPLHHARLRFTFFFFFCLKGQVKILAWIVDLSGDSYFLLFYFCLFFMFVLIKGAAVKLADDLCDYNRLYDKVKKDAFPSFIHV